MSDYLLEHPNAGIVLFVLLTLWLLSVPSLVKTLIQTRSTQPELPSQFQRPLVDSFLRPFKRSLENIRQTYTDLYRVTAIFPDGSTKESFYGTPSQAHRRVRHLLMIGVNGVFLTKRSLNDSPRRGSYLSWSERWPDATSKMYSPTGSMSAYASDTQALVEISLRKYRLRARGYSLPSTKN